MCRHLRRRIEQRVYIPRTDICFAVFTDAHPGHSRHVVYIGVHAIIVRDRTNAVNGLHARAARLLMLGGYYRLPRKIHRAVVNECRAFCIARSGLPRLLPPRPYWHGWPAPAAKYLFSYALLRFHTQYPKCGLVIFHCFLSCADVNWFVCLRV